VVRATPTRLPGLARPAPTSWTTVIEDDKRFCEIEARSDGPHSIQLECFLFEDELYVNSHRFVLADWWPVVSWAAIWLEYPQVRVCIGDSIFLRNAVAVKDPKTRDSILRMRGFDPPPEGIIVFRFDPRS
jgi:hypothetical protein